MHCDFDAGQVAIDGCGEPVVVDLASSGGYAPPELADQRHRYYRKSTRGHNEPMLAGRATRTTAAGWPTGIVASMADSSLSIEAAGAAVTSPR